MMEVYVLVEKKKTLLMQVCGALLLVLAVASFILSCFSTPVMIVFAVVFGVAFYFVYQYSNLEYEYSYFDGDVRFARVMNKSRRKQLKGYTMEEVVLIAPEGDASVRNYEQNPKVKKIDYSSGFRGVSCYEMVLRGADSTGPVIIRFEPDEAYLNAVCMKYGQRVVRR